MPKQFPLAVLGMLFALPFAIDTTAANSYVEDFTTTIYKDELNTTADWDTTAGVLRLFPLPVSIGSFATPDHARCVVVAGNLAFVADDDSGLQLIDISDPASPVLVGTCDTPGNAYGVAVAGDLAFVADGASGLQVIDISDPTSPFLAGSYDTPGSAWGVAVAGNLAFMADGEYGLQVIDISDPTSPFLAGSYDTPGSARGVAVAGNLAFVADGEYGLQVIDISDPTSPFLADSHDTPGCAHDVAVSGDFAFVANYSSGLQIIDISDPSGPFLAGSYDTPGNAMGVAVAGNLTFVADEGSGLQVIDISDPSSPVLAGTYDMLDWAESVTVAGDLAFVADAESGLQVVRVRQFLDPVLAGSHDTPEIAWDVVVSGDLAFVADNYGGLRIIDITDPTSPVLAGSYDTPDIAFSVAVAGNLAFVADGASGLQVIDITDPSNPVLAGAYDTPGYADGIAVAGNLAFVADEGSGLQVIDITDPTSPVLAGTYDTPGYAFGIAVAGNLAFVADGASGLQVIDISDPSSPSLAGTYDTPGYSYRIAVAGDLALVADAFSGLQVIDISDPSSPVLTGSYTTSDLAHGVAVSGNLAFVADGVSGLHVVDISDPSSPVFAGSYDTLDSAVGVAVSGDLAFVADWSQGLQVIQVYQHEVDTTNNIGQSLAVDSASDIILHARLSSTETDDVTWGLSADAGTNWQAFIPNDSWTQVIVPGDDLLWRTTHTWSPGVNPTVLELALDWLNEFGPITSIADIPDDQGGWLRLSFLRSGYDFAYEDSLPVTGYQIFRRVDDVLFRDRIREEGEILAPLDVGESASVSFDPYQIRRLEDREYLLGGDRFIRGEMPPGTWEVLTWVAAQQVDDYLVAAPTLADSTIQDGIHWSVFLTTTHTTTPSIWFACYPDSGYSVDNIAPGVPSSFLVDHDGLDGVSLVWSESPEEDFQYFRIYHGVSEDFEIGPKTLVHETAETSWLDTDGGLYHFYKLTALDHAGNESDPASPDEVTGAEVSVPARIFLARSHPNPFNPKTSISFGLPVAGQAHLAIYDMAGRLLRVLVSGALDAGVHVYSWDGRDEVGEQVSSGIYFARLRAGDVSLNQKMVLLK